MRYQCWLLGSLVKQLRLDMSISGYVTLIPLLPPEDWNDSSVLPCGLRTLYEASTDGNRGTAN